MSAIMDAYDVFCGESEKQAALIAMFKQALHMGSVSENLTVVYAVILGEYQTKVTAAGDALYEIAIEHERRRGAK